MEQILLTHQENTVIKQNVSNITDFFEHLVETFHAKQQEPNLCSMSSEDESSEALTSYLTNEVFHLLKKFHSNSDVINYVFLLACFVPLHYNVCESKFVRPVTVKCYADFLTKSKLTLEKYTHFQSKHYGVKQASAFCCLAEIIKDEYLGDEAEHYFFQIAQYVKCKFTELDSRIVDLIDFQHCNLNEVLTTLGCIKDDNVKTKVLCWNYFEDHASIVEFSAPVPRENVETVSVEKTPVWNFLHQLGLLEYFPRKLSVHQILSIQDNTCKEIDNVLEIPWVILRKIISINVEFREKVLDNLIAKMSSESKNEGTVEDFFSNQDTEENENVLQFIHPQDVFLAIFQCCDPFLQKVVVQKIFDCKLAIPLIYPDLSDNILMWSPWALRDIFVDTKSECVATYALKTVAFLRIGNGVDRSKSRTINKLLRDTNQEHSTFFHKDCALGMNQRILSNGVIEASWLIPCSMKHDTTEQTEKSRIEKICEPLTILNLRGDGLKFENGVSALLLISNIIVVFVKLTDLLDSNCFQSLNQIFSSGCFAVILTNIKTSDTNSLQRYIDDRNIDKNKIKFLSTLDIKKNRNLNESEINNALTKLIRSLLTNVEKGIKLDEMSSKLKIKNSESKKCKDAHQKAAQIHQHLKKPDEMSICKENILPLQGDALWHEWSKKQKEHKRAKNLTRVDTEEYLLNAMTEIRLQQVEACNKAPNAMSLFVRLLVEITNDDDTVQYFLTWVRQYMDSQSRIVIPELLEQFNQAFKIFEESKTRSKNEKEELDRIEKKLALASFGLEHFFREMGQIYEAFMLSKENMHCAIAGKTFNILNRMPAIAANALLSGQPLELMDGDASNVPLKWLKKVFLELNKITVNKYIFTLSVLGVQSSGKSTLLNTMFGVRFAVSAGRCTRGIYAQLIPVDRKQSSLQCDYVLVVDTEGLRAPELAGEKVIHDNELATLVIGLADLVLINIKGETIADMENVLQIVVHALLRLKQANRELKLNQRCMFVHQNVAEKDDKLQQGIKRIVENLDKMTKEVALEEKMFNVSSFRDVIKFDPTKDVWYIPDLWHGTPPMAPASPDYSKAVAKVAQSILKHASDVQHSFLTMSSVFLRFESLWTGILAEDFVFSFRNCLESKAYSILETEYQRLSFELDMHKLEWININVRPRLCKYSNITDIDMKVNDLIQEFGAKQFDVHLKAEKKLTDFIDKSKEYKDIMIQWKNHKIECLKNKAETLQNEAKQKICHEREICSNIICSSNLLVTKEKEINDEAKKLARSFEGKLVNSETIGTTFNSWWTRCFNQLAPEPPVEELTKKDSALKNDLKATLKEKFSKDNSLIQSELSKCDLDRFEFQENKLVNSIQEKEIKKEHYSKKSFMEYSSKLEYLSDVFSKPKKLVLNIINSIFKDIDTIFEDLVKQDTEYEKTQFSRILEVVKTAFQKNSDEDSGCNIVLTSLLQIYVVTHVTRFAYSKFKTMNREYEERHGLRTQLQKYKPKAFQLFSDICEAKSQEIIATNILCAELKGIIKEKVCRGLHINIQKIIINKYFMQKNRLMREIMTDLATKNDFNTFTTYINSTDAYVLSYLTELTNTTVFNTKDDSGECLYTTWAMEELEFDIKQVKEAASSACEISDGTKTDMKTWKNDFKERLDGKGFVLMETSLQHVTDYRVEDFSEFSKNIIAQMFNVSKELTDEFRAVDQDCLKWVDKTPYQDIYETLWGCKQTCPWCGEPCQRSQPNHASSNDCHTCIQHRPNGVTGTHWRHSNKLCVESCSFLVQSSNTRKCGKWCGCPVEKCDVNHPYNTYKTYINDWDITPNVDMSNSVYWNWFMASFYKQLSEYYNLECPDVPPTWKTITKKDAIESLTAVYGW